MKHLISAFLLFLILPIFLISCSDNITLTITNNSSSTTNISSPELSIDITIEPKQEKIVSLTNIGSDFFIKLTMNSSTKTYHFQDVDHYFSVTHEVKVLIDNNNITFTGSRNERFSLEN